MPGESASGLTESERADLMHGCSDVSEAVAARAGRGETVAKGLLAQADTEEAKQWFAALSDEWVLRGEEIWETKFEKRDLDVAEMSPWHEYNMGLLAGILARADTEAAAHTASERVAEPFVDELDQRELEHRIDLVGMLSGFLIDSESHEAYAETLRRHVDENGDDWDRAYYLPHATVLDGIRTGDAAEVTAGITDLVAFHEEFVVGARDANVVDEAVALNACAMLALARGHGLDVSVESEYVPEALADDEYYPVVD